MIDLITTRPKLPPHNTQRMTPYFLFKTHTLFVLFIIYLPLQKGFASYTYNLYSTLHKDTLYQF